MKFSVSCLIFLLLCLSTSINSQNVAITNVIAEDFTTSSDDVLHITFNETLPKLPFVVAWQDSTGRQYARQFITSNDDFVLPMGNQTGWAGKLMMVGLSVNDQAKIRPISIMDHWNDFIATRSMTPGTVNFTNGYHFKGYSLKVIAIGIAAIFLIAFLVFKRQFHWSLLCAFLIGWLVYDARNIYNRWEIMDDFAQEDYEIFIFKDIDIFLKEAREIISDKSWAKERLSGVINSYCTYQLADLNYKSSKYDNPKDADYIITSTPKNREIVYQHNNYFLVTQNKD